MEKIECIRRVNFCSGHRILGHESGCANAHGHNYSVFIYAVTTNLDDVGRVVDFAVLKEKVGGWINTHWDHTFIISSEDTELLACKDILEKNKPAFVSDFNPTAENMASYLLNIVCPKVLSATDVDVIKIELHETENCKVIVTK